MHQDTRSLVTAYLLIALGLAGMFAAGYLSHTTTPVTIVQTVHNVRYHGMTCTETIYSTGNSYMNGCS